MRYTYTVNNIIFLIFISLILKFCTFNKMRNIVSVSPCIDNDSLSLSATLTVGKYQKPQIRKNEILALGTSKIIVQYKLRYNRL